MKYFRLTYVFFISSLNADLQYRVNFLSRIFTDIFWYLAQIMVIETIYLHTDNIAGWSASETRVFLGVLFLVDALYMISFSENFDSISQKIRKGDLDLLLVKPINSQFMISLQRFNTAIFGNLCLALGYLIWALSQVEFSGVHLLFLVVLIPCSLMICYSIRFLFACIAVLTTRAENIQFLWYQIYKLGSRPDTIYPKVIQRLFLTLLPVALIAALPARGVLGKLPVENVFLTLFTASIFLALTTWVWRKSLGQYTSASS